MKGSVLDKKRKQQGGTALSASAGYAKKMAEMAAVCPNERRNAWWCPAPQGMRSSPMPESAVTTDGAHPFSTGTDECLVHNGSLSNHNDLRRRLGRAGLSFSTQNDTEVAAGYLTWRMREGASLRQALEASLDDLDGFFTFVVGTETGFAVLRDPIACKPAVMAETDDYVAFGSEYRALVGLPGIAGATVFEPEPARVYVWERH